MDDEMSNVGELLVEKAEENQTRKILEILNTCKDLEEAKEKGRPPRGGRGLKSASILFL